MLEFRRAKSEDAQILVEIAGRSFAEDEQIYGSVDPELSSLQAHQHFIENAQYFAILSDLQLIGGVCAIERGEGACEIGIIYVDPTCQNKGIGAQALEFVETNLPYIKRWFLDTGYLSYRNHHFYRKMGYRVIGTTTPESNGYYKLIFEKELEANTSE